MLKQKQNQSDFLIFILLTLTDLFFVKFTVTDLIL